MKSFLLKNMLIPDIADNGYSGDIRSVVLLNLDEFRSWPEQLSHKKAAIYSMEHDKYCKAEFFGKCTLGTINVPFQKEKCTLGIRFGFYIQAKRLFLVGEIKELMPMIGRMRENYFPDQMTVSEFFCKMLNSTLDDDGMFLQGEADYLSHLEDMLLEGITENFYKEIVPCRRKLTELRSFYYQLMNLSTAMRSNTNQLLNTEDCLAYGNLADRAQRLLNQVEIMHENLMQIREMYQAQLDIKQTRAMNLLAVISAVFLPLTLLTGWYGMNFNWMPELKWKWGYPFIIIISATIAAVEVYIFKKKKLL